MDEDSKKFSDEEQKAFIKALIKSFSDVPINELTAEYIQQSLCCTKETAVILLAHVMHSRGQLREEVKDLVARNVHSLEEICSVCKTKEVFNAISISYDGIDLTSLDDYVFGENLTKAALEIGNAVPIKLVEASGKVFYDIMMSLINANVDAEKK